MIYNSDFLDLRKDFVDFVKEYIHYIIGFALTYILWFFLCLNANIVVLSFFFYVLSVIVYFVLYVLAFIWWVASIFYITSGIKKVVFIRVFLRLHILSTSITASVYYTIKAFTFLGVLLQLQ